jgi:hypothetical protein
MNRRKNQPPLLAALFALLVLALRTTAFAEALNSPEWGYALDLPEGYALTEKSGTTRYHFTHQLYPCELQIALYAPSKFTAAKDALSFVTKQLSSTGTEVAFTWRNRDAAIGKIEAQKISGWALALELANAKGWIVLISYAEAEKATDLEALMISTLDAVFTDQGSYFETGPMTAFAWPDEKPVTQKFQDRNASLDVPFNSADAGGNQSVVDREFRLLTSYLDTKLVTAAWQRYYRMIYRDAWNRLSKATFMAGSAWPEDTRALTEKILSWTQGFVYERDLDGADFTDLPDAFASRKGDCDARSLLMVLMLNQLGVDAVLLVSPEYSHAVAAVDCPGDGARFPVGKKKYLICDTTAKVAPGLIASDMADPSKWFAVTFYAFPQ